MANRTRPTVPRVQRPAPPPSPLDGGSSPSRYGQLIAAWLGVEPPPRRESGRPPPSEIAPRPGQYADQRRDRDDELRSACGLNLRPPPSLGDSPWAPSVVRVHVDLVRTEIDRGPQRLSSRHRVIPSRDRAPRFRVASF